MMTETIPHFLKEIEKQKAPSRYRRYHINEDNYELDEDDPESNYHHGPQNHLIIDEDNQYLMIHIPVNED